MIETEVTFSFPSISFVSNSSNKFLVKCAERRAQKGELFENLTFCTVFSLQLPPFVSIVHFFCMFICWFSWFLSFSFFFVLIALAVCLKTQNASHLTCGSPMIFMSFCPVWANKNYENKKLDSKNEQVREHTTKIHVKFDTFFLSPSVRKTRHSSKISVGNILGFFLYIQFQCCRIDKRIFQLTFSR